MITKIFLFFTSVAFLGCTSQSPEEKIENLNGYWEIRVAETPSGNPKEYRFNSVVDYIQVQGREGIRTKVRPQLDGTYITSGDAEEFSVKIENDSIHLYYVTPYSTWRETLLSSGEDEIEILSQYGTKYTYQRFTPYSMIDHGKAEE